MKISIPEPCSEDWSKMTPTAKGAFCQKCALEVTDFTEKSSLEIKSILTEKIQSKQRVCGHIENRQLVEFNYEFIPWKSDQESFRAIWMFSLVAVFGLTLFSCQSTFSKEIVEKMNTSTEQMMEAAEDTLDIAKLNDSIKQFNGLDSLEVTFPEVDIGILPGTTMGSAITITDGGFGIDFENNLKEIVCVVDWIGDFIVVGSVTGDHIPESKDSIDVANFYIDQMTPLTPAPQSQSPRVNERNQSNSQRLDAKLENGKPNFEAHIAPMPIEKSSKIYVTIPEEGNLRLSIWEIPSITNIYSENFDLVFGNHSIDINFHEFVAGKYAVQLIWEDEKVIVPFEVIDSEQSETT